MRDYFVVLNKNMLDPIPSYMDFSKINLSGVVMENGDNLAIKLNGKQIPSYDFSKLRSLIESNSPPGGGKVFFNRLQDKSCRYEKYKGYYVGFRSG